MQDNQNFVFRGLDSDNDLRSVKSERYIDGNDIEHFVDETNTLGGIRRMKGTKLGYTIPNITPQFSNYRFPFITTGNTDYRVTIIAPYYLQFTIVNVPPTTTGVSNLGTSLEGNIVFTSTFTDTLGEQLAALSNGAFRLDINITGSLTITVETSPTGTADWVIQPFILLQEPISYTAEMQPLSTALVGDKQFVLSKAIGQAYCEIGCAVRDINGAWTYTRLLGSQKLNLPTTEVIDMRAEVLGNDTIGVYWVDNTNKPKVFYCNNNLNIPVFRYYWATTNSQGLNRPGVYLNKLGTYNLNNVDVQTNLQIFNNKALVVVDRQIATGGSLKSGGKRYYVRFGVNSTENTTPFNDIGEYTIVYKADNQAPRNAVKIKGDITPEITTKQIVLKVTNCMADVFNFLELVCVEYEGGGTSAILVDRYDITSETTEIVHSGNELDSTPFDPAAIVNVKPVILTGKTNEIKKNRYNIANVQIDGDVDAYSEIASKITIKSGRKLISRVGEIYTGTGSGQAFQVSNYKVTPETGGSQPLTKSSTFYTAVPYNVNNNPYIPPVFNTTTGVYTANVSTAGVNDIKFNFSISSDKETSVTGAVSSGGGVDFASVSVYHLNADDTVKAVLWTEEFKPTTNTTPNPLAFLTDVQIQRLNVSKSLDLKANMAAGEKIRADWFVQGRTQWDIQSTGFSSVTGNIDSFNFGKQLGENEYQKAENVANNMGYMLYEEYPYYIKFHKKSGYTTAPYYIGNHTILPSDFGPGYVDGYGIDVELTRADGNPWVYHPIFSDIDVASIRNEIVGFSFWRGDITNPKVIACGVNLMANEIAAEGFYAGFYASNPTTLTYGVAVPIGNLTRRYSGFIAPDNLVMDGELVKFQTGDKMYMAGQPTIFTASARNNIASSKGQRLGSFIEYTGYCPRADRNAMPTNYAGNAFFRPATLEDAVFTPFSETSDRFIYNTLTGLANPTKLVLNKANTFKPTMSTAALAVSFAVARNIVPARQSEDYGVYVGYYYRESNTLDIENINVVDTNSYYNLTDADGGLINDISVFGGDTYIQKSYLRLLYSAVAPNITNVETATKYESFISFYTQNRYNTQMRRTSEEGCVLFPADAESIAQYLDDDNEEFYLIDGGYNQQTNKLTRSKPYNDKLRVQTKFPTRIYYTAQRPTGSSYDSFRDIAPLDFKDLDGKNGQISALYDINDTMIAIQKFAVSVLPYQTDVLLRSDAGAEIYVGNGGVYAQRESIVGTYGTNIQTNSFRGFNKNGNASLYWFSEVTKKVFRYGRDGIQCLSDNAFMRNFFLTRTKLLENEFDLIMGFDTKRDNLWISAKAYKEGVIPWGGNDYSVGDIVSLYGVTFYNYPLFFRAIQPSMGGDEYPLTNPDYGEQIPMSDGNYYSIFTILFNEKLNTFTSLCGALPNRYFQYNNELLVPNVKSAWGKVYELNNGTDTYFDGLGIDFYVQPVVNKVQNTTKRFLSIGLNTGEDQTTFPTVDFATKTQESTSVDFEQKNGNIFTAVEPALNGDQITGEYMTFKIVSANDITILDAVAKMYYRPRMPR